MIPKTLADAQQSPPAQRGRCASIRSLSSHYTIRVRVLALVPVPVPVLVLVDVGAWKMPDVNDQL